MAGQNESNTPTPTADARESKPKVTDDEIEAQNRQEAIDYHSELLTLIRSDIDKDVIERSVIIDLMQKAKTPQEYKAQEDRLKTIERNIINKEANLQAEQDLVDSTSQDSWYTTERCLTTWPEINLYKTFGKTLHEWMPPEESLNALKGSYNYCLRN